MPIDLECSSSLASIFHVNLHFPLILLSISEYWLLLHDTKLVDLSHRSIDASLVHIHGHDVAIYVIEGSLLQIDHLGVSGHHYLIDDAS